MNLLLSPGPQPGYNPIPGFRVIPCLSSERGRQCLSKSAGDACRTWFGDGFATQRIAAAVRTGPRFQGLSFVLGKQILHGPRLTAAGTADTRAPHETPSLDKLGRVRKIVGPS